MTHNHFIGGKGKPAKERPPRPVKVWMVCDNCQARLVTMILPGDNDIIAICSECGAEMRAHVEHDGYGNARIVAWTIETVESENK